MCKVEQKRDRSECCVCQWNRYKVIGPREESAHLNLSAEDAFSFDCDHGELQTLDDSDGLRCAALLHPGCRNGL